LNARLITLLVCLGAAGLAAWLYFRNQASGASDDAVGGVVDTLKSAVEPRGVRNNNPGNIRISSNAWQGKVTPNTDGTFEQFDTMVNGIRAIAVTVTNYQRLYGLHTVRGIITRWSATDQDAYVANVASGLGVDPDDSIDVGDPATLTGIVNGIIVQENGALGALLVSSDDVSQGVALA